VRTSRLTLRNPRTSPRSACGWPRAGADLPRAPGSGRAGLGRTRHQRSRRPSSAQAATPGAAGRTQRVAHPCSRLDQRPPPWRARVPFRRDGPGVSVHAGQHDAVALVHGQLSDLARERHQRRGVQRLFLTFLPDAGHLADMLAANSPAVPLSVGNIALHVVSPACCGVTPPDEWAHGT
jgi:hypothetical protein